MLEGILRPSGNLSAVLIKGYRKAPLSWTIRNRAHWHFLKSWFGVKVVIPIARAFGIMTAYAELRAVHINGKTGVKTDYGVISYRVITDAGVAFLVDAWQNSVELEIMKYHGAGTGTGAEAAGDTTLGTESTTALNPDSTRATGSLTEGATGNIFKTVGTLTFDADAAITEHGVFSQEATGGGTLWDRSKFSAINVVGASGDSIQFTYQVTFTSGG